MAENFNGFGAQTMAALWAIAYLQIKLIGVMHWLDKVCVPLRERTRRLISHFGAVRLLEHVHVIKAVTGMDFTN